MGQSVTHEDERRINMYLGAAIDYWLRERKMSRATLERYGIISRKHIWEMRKGHQGTTVLTLIKIAVELNVDPRDIIGDLVEIVFNRKLDDETIIDLVETGEFSRPSKEDETKEN